MNKLIQIGFRPAGEWIQDNGKIRCALTHFGTSKNILYAFVSDHEVLYVGKTVQALKKRMYGYQNPGTTQSTNIKGKKFIKEMVAKGKRVKIIALPDNGLLHFGVFHLNLAAGLEDNIVSTLKPKWNQTGK